MKTIGDIPFAVLRTFRRGTVIPAMPLALDQQRNFDRTHQRALLRYYVDAGVGGVAVGVHSTQFEIRNPDVALYRPVIEFCSAEIESWSRRRGVEVLQIAGVTGPTAQAVEEAEFAAGAGYHACLLSLAALSGASEDDLIEHCSAVAAVMPVIGFYLQPAVGGRVLRYEFWRRFARIENVLGIKIAPFNRYRTIDVVRAVADARKEDDVMLYTGNDDAIVQDLLTRFILRREGSEAVLRIRGGLLGHWGFWTKRAVELLEQIHAIVENDLDVPLSLIATGAEITDTNAAVFDPQHDFSGCIPGIHEMLVRQGLFAGRWCLDDRADLSEGQLDAIDRVHRAYPHLNDYDFVRSNLSEWFAE